MKVLELFAGARCIGRAAEKLGHEVLSLDWHPYEGVQLVMDANNLKLEDIPIGTRHVHCSFDCTVYTIAAISHHRRGVIPFSDYAIFCDNTNQYIISLIKQLEKREGVKISYSFENPRGMLRKMPWMQEFTRYTVWYCQYGDDRAKPTDIWTNLDWTPRAICHNGNKNCHHAPAPRGAKTGTQGRKDAHNRSLIPEQLCIELMSCLGKFKEPITLF
jgi:hypothetical protein